MRRPVDILADLRDEAQNGHAQVTWDRLCELAALIEATRFLVGVGVIVINHGRVLLSQRLAGASHGVGWWSCPGGGLEGSDATVIDGALRELREETGLEVIMTGDRAPRRLDHCEEGKRSDGQPYLTAFVVCHVDDLSRLANPEPHKHGDWRWFHLSELPQHMWSRDIVADVLLGVA